MYVHLQYVHYVCTSVNVSLTLCTTDHNVASSTLKEREGGHLVREGHILPQYLETVPQLSSSVLLQNIVCVSAKAQQSEEE